MFERILIVDDESAARIALATLLRREGFEVRDASDGAAALAECAAFRPDLILLDIVMPGMDGFEVCRRIKATPETRLTPVVLITGLSATEDRIKGINAGADDFLSKPIDFNELLARTRSLLRLKQYHRRTGKCRSACCSAWRRASKRAIPTLADTASGLAEMSARLGERLGLPEEDIKALRRAGIVHDIGKVVVPDAILLKPGPLTAEEAEIMRKHPVVGEHICAPLRTFRLVLPIIRHHHERHDGSGYPDGLRGDEIPLTAAHSATCGCLRRPDDGPAVPQGGSPRRSRCESWTKKRRAAGGTASCSTHFRDMIRQWALGCRQVGNARAVAKLRTADSRRRLPSFLRSATRSSPA